MNSSKVDQMEASPYNWWTSAKTKYADREVSEGDNDASLLMANFLKMMKGNQTSICSLV